MKHLAIIALSAAGVFMAAAAPGVENVALTQEAEGLVKITYDLTGDPGIVLLDILADGVSIGESNLTHTVGDVNRRLEPGAGKTIWWACEKDVPGIDGSRLSASVTAYSLDAPPDVMVLDLKSTNGYTFCRSEAGLPDGGLANDIYRTERLVMKKVHAKGVTFLSGNPEPSAGTRFKPFLATFTYDYYLGIYPVTQGQQLLIDGKTHSEFTNGVEAAMRPVDKVNWVDVRYWYEWPKKDGTFSHDDFNVNSWGLLAKFRRCGLLIDLPTSAEWEYACRAGTQTLFGNGTDNEAGLARMGWYSGNSGGTTHPVGRKEPNAWGFYDMHGNVWEWCLDWFRSVELWGRTEVRTDYPGEPAETGTYSAAKAKRGGAYDNSWDVCTSHYFNNYNLNAGPYVPNGYRICVKAVIP